MKRTLKIIGLAAVVALCPLLTGCYQPPDEVNNNGQPVGAATTSFFNTLAPTATVAVTPDTVVIETQNPFGGQTGVQVTPAPTQPDSGGNGWDNWGTAQTPTPGALTTVTGVYSPTPSPGSGAIEVVTSMPPTAPPI